MSIDPYATPQPPFDAGLPGSPAQRPGCDVPPRRPTSPALLFIAVLLLAFVLVPYLTRQISYSIARGRAEAEATVAKELLAELPEGVNRYAWAAKAIEPSVVGIETQHLVRGRNPWGLPEMGQGLGSGVIVDPEGYIVTNYHVIRGATEVTVRLVGDRTVPAKVVGTDEPTDLALLKISDGKQVAAPWGDSEKLRVGDPVIAVGSPFGLMETVTSGIVSAKNRRARVENITYEDFLQTDAAVNPGNSGGPLVNLQGELVGINTAIFGESYRGISFAIPSSLVQQVYKSLRETGTVVRGWLGVQSQDLTPEMARQLGLKRQRGALVMSVLNGSPAEAAGISPGDVILKWGDRSVGNAGDLVRLVGDSKVGSAVKVTVLRDDEEKYLTVKVGQRPAQLGR